ncbi:MAG TPA: glucose 1-dehydrogenase [Chitinophaga sp.]
MKAIAIKPGTPQVRFTERPEPDIQAETDIKIKVLQVGICGTDREEAAGGRADPPAGSDELVIGHEMFGQVVATGGAVTKVQTGDYAVFTVRRGCGQCAPCLNNRSDMCYTGQYTERGIKGLDGYQTEYVVDAAQYVVKVPEEIRSIGVLTEPMSVAAKAIDEALQIQTARLKGFVDTGNWLKGKRALVAGIGPIGLLAAFALRLRGAEVLGLDIVPEDNLRARLLQDIGGRYLNGNNIKVTDIDEQIGPVDFAFEAAGIAQLQIQLIDTLAPNGIYVATGIPSGERPLTIAGGALMQQLVLNNQVVIGSVNASMQHFAQAVDYLLESKKKWPEAIEQVITERLPVSRFEEALDRHDANEIKVVIDWTA